MLKIESGLGTRSYWQTQPDRLSHTTSPTELPALRSGSFRKLPGADYPQLRSPKNLRSPSPASMPRSESDSSFGLGLFLNQALQTPLLTAEGERDLARRIHCYRLAFQRKILKEPAVVGYLVELLTQWELGNLRLDAVCNVALGDRETRKKLEPAINKNLKALRRLLKTSELKPGSLASRKNHRTVIELIEPLMIRPRHFEASPFEMGKARNLLAGYLDLCQQMTHANMRLVVRIAKQLCGSSPVLGDMIQEGARGLMHAVTKFDHRRRVRFSTYATPWIKQTIYATLPNAQRNIRVPEGFRSLGREVQRRMKLPCEGHFDSGRNLGLIAEEMEITVRELERLICIQQDTCSLDQPHGNDESVSNLGDSIPDDRTANPSTIASVRERQLLVRKLMEETLNQKEQDVVELRFGINDGVDRSLAEVGREMGLTRERVRQIEKVAFKKLESTACHIEFGT